MTCSADQDTFLPSAIQRYHQLFMPVLQLVHGMLATLGPKHSTAAYQVAGFLHIVWPFADAGVRLWTSYRITEILLSSF